MEESSSNQTTNAPRDDLSSRQTNDAGGIVLPPIVLASASPRRAEILRVVGWPFEIFPVDVDESRFPGEDASTYIERLACKKAEAAGSRLPNKLVLGADTVVVIDDQILGKPNDHEDARRMLILLNGRWHEVRTGVALYKNDASKFIVEHETTEVKFAVMSDAEIDWYVATGEPLDKAGAYAIQGRGARLIEGIRGDYFNVVGLPIRLVYRLAKQI